MHRCRSRRVHVQAITDSHSNRFLWRSFLSDPLPSFSISIFCLTKGVFLFQGSQKPLGPKSRNCRNWQRRGETLGARMSPYSNYSGRDAAWFSFRVHTKHGKLLSWIVITCLLPHYGVFILSHLSKDLSLFCGCSITFTCKLVAGCAPRKMTEQFLHVIWR